MTRSHPTGPRSHVFKELLEKHTHRFVDRLAGRLRPFLKRYLGELEFLAIKDDIAAQVPVVVA